MSRANMQHANGAQTTHVAFVDDAALCCTHLRANVRGIGAGHKLAQKTIQLCTLDVAIACGQTEREKEREGV